MTGMLFLLTSLSLSCLPLSLLPPSFAPLFSILPHSPNSGPAGTQMKNQTGPSLWRRTRKSVRGHHRRCHLAYRSSSSLQMWARPSQHVTVDTSSPMQSRSVTPRVAVVRACHAGLVQRGCDDSDRDHKTANEGAESPLPALRALTYVHPSPPPPPPGRPGPTGLSSFQILTAPTPEQPPTPSRRRLEHPTAPHPPPPAQLTPHPPPSSPARPLANCRGRYVFVTAVTVSHGSHSSHGSHGQSRSRSIVMMAVTVRDGSHGQSQLATVNHGSHGSQRQSRSVTVSVVTGSSCPREPAVLQALQHVVGSLQ